MTKDYAKKRIKDSGGRSAPSGSTLPGWIWLFMGVLLGVGLAVFIFWKWGQSYQYRPAQPPVVISENDSAPVEQRQVGETKNRFDFYTLLPDLKVDIPETAESQPKQAKQPTSSSVAYILQAGSFRTFKQADKLRAELALNGFESEVQTVEISPNETWYRVYIGPFTTKSEALATQQNLQQSLAANSLILKIRV